MYKRQESEELGPKLNAFISDFEAGKDIKAQAEELKAEFKVLQDAAAYYKACLLYTSRCV